MTRKKTLYRFFKLLHSSFRIIRGEGFSVFIRYLLNWLKGQRGAYQSARWSADPPINYNTFWRQALLTPQQYTVQSEAAHKLDPQPIFGIITHLDTSVDIFQYLNDSLATLRNQTYPHWLWYLVVERASQGETIAGSNYTLKENIEALIQQFPNRSILLVGSAETIITNHEADYILSLSIGDQLSPDALYQLANEANQSQADIIYTDYDYLVRGAEHFDNPVFKPDWSPELMLSFNLLRHLACFRWEFWTSYSEADLDNHEFGFKVSETTSKIVHIPRVLYHRRLEHRENDFRTTVEPVIGHLQRQGLRHPQAAIDEHSAIRVTWGLQEERHISIIIPSRDQPTLIHQCLSSIFDKTTYKNFVVIVVDTGSIDPDTQTVYDRYGDEARFQLVHYHEPFNFSRACNFGADHAEGDLLLFLNNDTEVLQDDWLYLMAQWFERPEIGVVGAKLLYPDGTLQHIGHIIGLSGITAHVMQGCPEHTMTMFGSDDWYRNFQAVTGACLMISRSVFEEVGRFDEAYQLNYSDVELCLAVQRAGYRIVYTPHVRLIHHESVTHQRQVPLEDTNRFLQRLAPISDDPYFNPNLTYQSVIPDIKRHTEDTIFTHYKNRIEMIEAEQRAKEKDITSKAQS